MQVSYTRITGETIAFTTNTAVTTANVYLGELNDWVRTNNPDAAAELERTATVKINGVAVDSDGVEIAIQHCYGDRTIFYSDHGFTLWAEERLSTEEFAIFKGQCSVWTASIGETDDPDMLFWWNKFITDPHVDYSE